MERRTIGDPSVFAVVYSVHSASGVGILYGPCHLIIGNLIFGESGNPIYLDSVLFELEGLDALVPNFNVMPAFPITPAGLIEFIEAHEICVTAPSFYHMEGFSHCNKAILQQGDTWVFCWCLDPDMDVIEHPEYAEYPREVQVVELPIKTIKEVAVEFRRQLDELKTMYRSGQLVFFPKS